MEFQEIYHDFKLEELERQIQGLSTGSSFSFEKILRAIYTDESKGMVGAVAEVIREAMVQEWSNTKNIFVTIVIIVLVSALFSSYKDVFQNSQIAELSFYVNYLVLIVVVTNLFGQALLIGEEALRTIEEFMRIFFPTYFCIVGSTTGVGTGLAYYQIAGAIIYLVEWGLLSLLLPALSTYMLLILMNGIWEEGKLVLFMKLFQKGIKFFLKLSLGVLTGAGILQSLIRPLMDRIKSEAIYKAVEVIPGIGEVTEGAMRMWLGSAALIKNSVGIAGCLFLLLICLSPIIKIFIFGGVLKITTAILSVAGEKKMILCLNHVGDAVFMVLQAVSYGLLFFVVLIAITAYSTNGGF